MSIYNNESSITFNRPPTAVDQLAAALEASKGGIGINPAAQKLKENYILQDVISKSDTNKAYDFLSNYLSDPSVIAGLIATAKRLPPSNYPAGQGPNAIPGVDTGAGGRGSYKNPRGSYQYIDDDFPNPFGGTGPYMPGASLPNQDIIAGILGQPAGVRQRDLRGPGQYVQQGPYSDIEQRRKDAERQLRLDLMEPPNPFGGGSLPYI